MISALTPVDVNVFQHEFVTMFRWSYYTTIHPDNIRILETIDERFIRYEKESGTVFMAKDVMARLRKHLGRGSVISRPRPSHLRRY